MSYSINASGRKADVIAAARSQAAAQGAGFGAAEKAQLDAVLDRAEKEVAAQGDSDQISLSLSGSRSEGPSYFSVTDNFGISVTRVAAGSPTPPPAPGPTTPGIGSQG